MPQNPSVLIESDASTKVWGSSTERSDKNTGCLVSSGSLNYLEIQAAFLALKAFGKSWTHLTVLLQMDNFAAVTYVNQKRDTCSQSLCQLTISIWEWCQDKNITLLAEHLPGHLNTAANTESSRAAPILVSVSVSGQYQHVLIVSESVKYIIQVPILLFVFFQSYQAKMMMKK